MRDLDAIERRQCCEELAGQSMADHDEDAVETLRRARELRAKLERRLPNYVWITETWDAIAWPEDSDDYEHDHGFGETVDAPFAPDEWKDLVDYLRRCRGWEPSCAPLGRDDDLVHFQGLWFTSPEEMDMETGECRTESVHLHGKPRNIKWALLLAGVIA